MKGIEIIKELIISILIVIIIFLILSVIFYDEISITKVIPEAEEFILTEEMQKRIESEKIENVEEVVTQYYIDAYDLKKYEKTHEYNKGKQYPFTEEQIYVDQLNNINSDGNYESGNFYEDDGTK